jgi:hypothetical protein
MSGPSRKLAVKTMRWIKMAISNYDISSIHTSRWLPGVLFIPPRKPVTIRLPSKNSGFGFIGQNGPSLFGGKKLFFHDRTSPVLAHGRQLNTSPCLVQA